MREDARLTPPRYANSRLRLSETRDSTSLSLFLFCDKESRIFRNTRKWFFSCVQHVHDACNRRPDFSRSPSCQPDKSIRVYLLRYNVSFLITGRTTLQFRFYGDVTFISERLTKFAAIPDGAKIDHLAESGTSLSTLFFPLSWGGGKKRGKRRTEMSFHSGSTRFVFILVHLIILQSRDQGKRSVHDLCAFMREKLS